MRLLVNLSCFGDMDFFESKIILLIIKYSVDNIYYLGNFLYRVVNRKIVKFSIFRY